MTPEATALLVLLAGDTTIHDAHQHAVDAVKAGATSEEVSQAIGEWMGLQGRQVQQVFAEQRRPDCCTGIHREHAIPAIPAGFDERYDPSPEPIDRSTP